MTLASWIVLALVVLGVVLLVGVAIPVLPKLRGLAVVMNRLQARTAQVQELQVELAGLQAKVAAVQARGRRPAKSGRRSRGGRPSAN